MKVALANSIVRYLISVGIVTFGIATFSTDLNRSNPDPIEQPSVTTNIQQLCSRVLTAKPFARTELFFGLRKPDGTEVTHAEFQRFLVGGASPVENREVTPRFPDGFILLPGNGQLGDR